MNPWFDQKLVFSKRFLPTHCWNDINDFSCENWSWLKITTLSGIKRMVGTSLKSWDIIFYDKNNFVNTCWPHDAIFLLWTFLEILKINIFTILRLVLQSTKVNQCWLKLFLLKSMIFQFSKSVPNILLEFFKHILQFPQDLLVFYGKIRVRNPGNFFVIKFSARQHLLTIWQLCW